MSAFDAINSASIERARDAGWPELTGTDEQVGWSYTVRDQKMREFDAADLRDPDRTRFREVLLRETHAAAWLDNRDHPWQIMLWSNLTADERAALLSSRAGE
ncbi:hypothetical protein ACFXO9_31550 [Nocardia tengchongensis]|uniref:hypothetical protein n=1 Tax=Nocardia tengchongensis TaxID=2055889 RepID=UPI0036C98BA7